MNHRLIMLALGGILAFPCYASAEEEVTQITPPAADARPMPMHHMHITNMMQPPAICLQENVVMNINFNIKAKSFTEAKTKYDEKMKQLDDFAKQQNLKKFDMQSMNYNINAQQIGYEDGAPVPGYYQLNGNASYRLDSADAAFKLGEFLTAQKFQVGVNVSKFNRPGMCNNTTIGE